MANTDRPMGFAPKGPLLRQNYYSVGASNTPAIFQNDIVMAEADGKVGAATAASVTKLGSAMNYIAVSTATTDANPLMVSDHPDQLYVAQDDGSQDPPVQGEIFQGADHADGAGSTVTLLSGHELALSTGGISAGGFVILDSVNREDNDITAINADWIVQLNIGEGLLTLNAGV